MHAHARSETAQPAQSAGEVRTGLFDASYADVDEQAAALTGWNQSYQQLSIGAFRGSIQRVDLGGVRLFAEGLQSSVYQTGLLQAGALALGVPLDCSEPGVFCGTPCHRESLHVFSGPGGFEFRTGSGHVMLGIELAPGLAQNLHGPPDGSQPFGRAAGIQAVPAPALDGLRQAMHGVLEAVRRESAFLGAASVRERMADFLVEKVTALVDEPAAARVAPDAHWSTVRAARDLVGSRLQQPPTVAELCTALKVSRRTLQSCFQRVLGISPLAFLRAARLGAARCKLKDGATVTDAATELGFWHFGHFARDYRAMFGELPSHTRRLCRQRL